jgi:hypothetical protein
MGAISGKPLKDFYAKVLVLLPQYISENTVPGLLNRPLRRERQHTLKNRVAPST